MDKTVSMHVFKHVQAFVIYQIVPIIVIQINIIQKITFISKFLMTMIISVTIYGNSTTCLHLYQTPAPLTSWKIMSETVS